MTNVELWNLIFGGFTAISTTAAVCISLWFALGKKKRFSIKDAYVRQKRTVEMETGKVTEGGNYLYAFIENHLEYEMKVFRISVNCKNKGKGSNRGSGVTMQCDGMGIIPQLSQYEVRVQIPRMLEPGSLENAKSVTLTFETSFGTKSMPFPQKWMPQLIDSIEHKGASFPAKELNKELEEA